MLRSDDRLNEIDHKDETNAKKVKRVCAITGMLNFILAPPKNAIATGNIATNLKADPIEPMFIAPSGKHAKYKTKNRIYQSLQVNFFVITVFLQNKYTK